MKSYLPLRLIILIENAFERRLFAMLSLKTLNKMFIMHDKYERVSIPNLIDIFLADSDQSDQLIEQLSIKYLEKHLSSIPPFPHPNGRNFFENFSKHIIYLSLNIS